MIGYNKNEIIGKMRERVILQNRVISQSDSGFQSETYSNIATLWTALDYKSGFEEEDADKIVSQQKINFTLRYNENITTNSRFVYRDSLYQIEKIDISNDRRFVFCTGVYRSSYTGSYELTIDVAASVNGSATISANVNSLLYLACQANASASTTATITKIIEVSSLVNANASLSGDINFVQKAQASLLATGTTTADLTVGSSVDADAAAFFARVTTAGGTLTTTEQNAVNTLVVQMKADGIWTKMKAIYPMVGASAAACAQNLKSSSFTGTFSSGWTFASTGVKPDGVSTFMDTTLLSNDFTSNIGGFSCYTRTNDTTGLALEYGSIDVHWIISWLSNSGGPGLGIMGNTYKNFTSISNSFVGLLVNQRSSSTQIKINYDGGNESASLNIISLGSTLSVYLGAWHYSGGAQYFGEREIAFFSKHDYLDDTESQKFIDSVQAFQTTLNRQV
jgi:SPP1 family predicted phage head-tail adaptor